MRKGIGPQHKEKQLLGDQNVSTKLKTTITALFCSALSVFLCGCSFATLSKPIAFIGVTGYGRKLDYPKLESLYFGVVNLITSAGFSDRFVMRQPSAYLITGERIYGAGLILDPSIACTLQFNRKTARVRFYELEIPRKSNIFPATDE